jgi:hypothetical protein
VGPLISIIPLLAAIWIQFSLKEIYMVNVGVHQTHCCVLHGCKYGDDENCPVFTGEVEQLYTCEYCDMDGIESLEQLCQIERGNVKRCPHCGHIL